MNSLLFLGIGAAAAVLGAMKNSAAVRKALPKSKAPVRFLPQAVSLLVITAQISELAKVIEHISIVHVAAALFLLAIVIAGKAGTEGELH